MATSPAPDAAAPPGMCPGIAVLGGGGAGGDGNGNGNGGRDGAGGDGNGDGKTGSGDGKNSEGCGAGSGNGCPNPQHGGTGTSAGDPIDVSSGRVYTLAVVDLDLPGPLHFAIRRSYDSTQRDRDVGLGHGWSHSLAWQVDIAHRSMRITNGLGNTWELDVPPIGEPVHVAKLKVTKEPNAVTVIDGLTGLSYRFESTSFVGPEQRFALTCVCDGYGNSILLDYKNGRLVALIDSAQRHVRVRWSGRHIAAFEVNDGSRWVSYRTYEHDVRGDLAVARDGYGNPTVQTYDDDHLLTSQRTPEGRTTFFRWDASNRCVETWVERPAGDPTLDSTVPPVLADHTTRAKGTLHTVVEYAPDYVEVITSRGHRRYTLANGASVKSVFAGGVHDRSYDSLGNVLEYVDGLGGKWSSTYDAAGRLTSRRDPLGNLMQWVFDLRGHLAREIRPDGSAIEYVTDDGGGTVEVRDTLGVVLAYQRDARGLVTRADAGGSITLMAYDAMGNRVYIREPNGGERKITYDALGLITRYLDEAGHESRFVYGANRELVASYDPQGRMTQLGYDRDGNLTSIVMPEGRFDLAWGGYESVHQIRRGDGSHIDFRYDREGDIVRVINPARESHTLRRDSEGRVTGEQTFDGRELSLQMDAQGNVTRLRCAGETIDIRYDALSRIVERTLADETIEVFVYDWAGRLVAADNGVVKCEFERDARGRIVRETQLLAGVAEAVESTFGSSGRVAMRTSHGHEARMLLDGVGAPREVALSGAPGTIKLSYDPAGLETERVFPGGAALRRMLDGMGRLSRRSLHDGFSHERSVGEPQWVGKTPGLVLEQLFEYVADSGRPTRIESTARGPITFSHDVLGQIRERAPTGLPSERFSYAAGDSVLDGTPREYASGGRLTRHGATTYRHDDAGRLIEKEVRGNSGDRSVWRYEWDGKGLLCAVTLPDTRRVEHVYDTQARRIEKRVCLGTRVLSRVRYVWDGDRVVHETAQFTADDGHVAFHERTYAYLPGSVVPFAHCDAAINGQRVDSPWIYYLSEAAGRPEVLIDDRGQPLGMFDAKAFGAMEPLHGWEVKASTNARFAGHWEDEETGLFYNRWRFFDPETGLYLSPEPIGLMGGLHPYRYAHNRPIDAFDPNGLMICVGNPGMGVPSASNNQNNQFPNENRGTPLNPIVQGCLASPSANGPLNPSGCAEPRYLSDYLNNKGITDPRDPRLKRALNDFKCTAYDDDPNHLWERRSPCPNCSQLFANLMAKYGAPSPNNIGKGLPTAGSVQAPTNFTSPIGKAAGTGWPSYDAALAHYAANKTSK